METRVKTEAGVLARIWPVNFQDNDLSDLFDLKTPIEIHGKHHSGRSQGCRLLAHAIGDSMQRHAVHDPSYAIPASFGVPVYFDDELSNVGLHHALRQCRINGIQVGALISNTRESSAPTYQNILDRLELGSSGVMAVSITLRSDFFNVVNDMQKASKNKLPPTVLALHRNTWTDDELIGDGRPNNVYVQVFNDSETDTGILAMAFRSITGEVCVTMYEIVRTSEYATFNNLPERDQNRILGNHRLERHSIENRRLDIFCGYISKLLGE